MNRVTSGSDAYAWTAAKSAGRIAEPQRPSCLHNRQIGAPGTDGVRVLPRHRANHLTDVTEIVRDPGREVLAERDDAELGMPAAARQIALTEPELVEPRQTPGPEPIEGVEQRSERDVLRRLEHRLAVEWRK